MSDAAKNANREARRKRAQAELARKQQYMEAGSREELKEMWEADEAKKAKQREAQYAAERAPAKRADAEAKAARTIADARRNVIGQVERGNIGSMSREQIDFARGAGGDQTMRNRYLYNEERGIRDQDEAAAARRSGAVTSSPDRDPSGPLRGRPDGYTGPYSDTDLLYRQMVEDAPLGVPEQAPEREGARVLDPTLRNLDQSGAMTMGTRVVPGAELVEPDDPLRTADFTPDYISSGDDWEMSFMPVRDFPEDYGIDPLPTSADPLNGDTRRQAAENAMAGEAKRRQTKKVDKNAHVSQTTGRPADMQDYGGPGTRGMRPTALEVGADLKADADALGEGEGVESEATGGDEPAAPAAPARGGDDEPALGGEKQRGALMSSILENLPSISPANAEKAAYFMNPPSGTSTQDLTRELMLWAIEGGATEGQAKAMSEQYGRELLLERRALQEAKAEDYTPPISGGHRMVGW